MTAGNDVFILHPAIAVVGRVMFALIFFASGVTHFTDLDSYVALMPSAIPFRTFWVVISAVVELVGGYGIFAADDPQMRMMQQSFFMKGVTMTGAALLITQLGVKRTA